MSTLDPFDFSRAMHRLCDDITARMTEFRYIRMDQVAVTIAQTRNQVSYGLQAKLTPMRFENGSLTTSCHGCDWTVQKLFQDDREMLYILTFYLPRFLNQTFHEKIVTVFHELYHISPLFDGDIRHMHGRYYAHTHSQKQYDQLMELFVDRYLQRQPSKALYQFLRHRFRTLHSKHGGVVGLQVPIPKLIPASALESA